MKKAILLFVVISFTLLHGLKAQNPYNRPLNRLNSVGFLLDIPGVDEQLPEYTGNGYAPILLQANLRFPLIKNNGKHQCTLMVQPQFNPVVPIEGYNGFLFEAGVNLGIAYEYYVPERAIIFIGAGVGPHYINVQTSQQADGFIFSDNLFAGVHQILSRDWFLTYELRIRHISNAGLQEPNGGIDNAFGGIGLSYFIR